MSKEKKQETKNQDNAKREYNPNPYPSRPIPDSTASGVAENVAALARKRSLPPMFPDVTMRAQEVSALGGWVRNEEREKSRTREIKNVKDKERELWEGWCFTRSGE